MYLVLWTIKKDVLFLLILYVSLRGDGDEIAYSPSLEPTNLPRSGQQNR
jgi:hypothetical protein